MCLGHFKIVVKMNMKSFIGRSLRSGLKTAVLLAAAGFAVERRASLQDSFGSVSVLVGDSGSVTNDNTLAIVDTGAPNIAGFAANAPLWYQWTASHDGEVELDTVGSDSGLDTVLGVYSGSSLSSLNQLAANDDLYPVNSGLAQIQPGFSVVSPVSLSPDSDFLSFFPYIQLYYGPSHLRFNAQGGQTYYFAVDTKPATGFTSTGSSESFNAFNGTFPTLSVGNVALSWAYKSSGVFRFATEDYDPITGLQLYQAAETESQRPLGTVTDENSVVGTYYTYNAPGALVTVTRAAGSKGRVVVQYTTVDGSSLTGGGGLGQGDVLAAAVYTNIAYLVDTNGAAFTNALGFTMATNYFTGDYRPVQWPVGV